MGNEVDLPTEAAKPKTPPAQAPTDVVDSTPVETADQTANDDQIHLLEGIWFSNDTANILQKSGEPGSVQPSVKPTGVEADADTEQGLTLTPIQTVLEHSENSVQAGRIDSETLDVGVPVTEIIVPSAMVAGGPDAPIVVAKADPVEAPVAKPDDRAPVSESTPVVSPSGDAPKPTTGDKMAGSKPLTDAEIEKLRQAIVEADRKGPDGLTTLLNGRKDALTTIGKFAAVDMNGKPDVALAAVESLKAQELKQALEYTEYLAPATIRTDLGTALIAKGDDNSIKEGERLLVEAVQARPDLIFHPNFRAQVMDSYNKMAEFRKSHNLEPWKAEIPLPPTKTLETGAWTDKTGEHFKAANEAYFNTGIKDALPEFQKAIEAADETTTHNQDRLAKERLALFVSGLTADRAIAQGQVTGESTTEMEKRRVDIWDKQVDNYVEDATGSRARMNVGLAMIASGDPEMLANGQQLLQDAAAKHPGLIYNPGLANFGNQFTEQLLGAYKANIENGGATADGTKPGGEAQAVVPAQFLPSENVESGYNSVSSKSPLPGSNTDMKVEGYGWDKATDIGLPIAVIAMGLYTGRRQYLNYQRNKAEREANFAIEPIERAGTQSDVVTRQKAGGGEERLEIKGRAQDGQVIAKNLTEGADTSASSKTPVDPPKDFGKRNRSGEYNYGEYQPATVDGKKYFLNKNGEAFEQKGGKLHPTDLIRGLTLSEAASHNLKPLPNDMQRTAFQNLGRELTPIGTLPDGRVVLNNSTRLGAPMRDWLKVPDNLDPFKGEFKDLQHQRIAGRDYFVSADSKVYTFLQPERTMMEVQNLVVKPADKVYAATGMPGSSASERALNKQVNDILEPLRTRLRAGEQVDALTKAEYMERARDALMPAAKEVAKSLGLPESVITDKSFRFAEINSLASHDSVTGEIKLNIFGDSHLTALDHEVKHKKQSLDQKAAVAADRAGFREALLERSINDIGIPGRRFTNNGIDSRPAIEDPKAVEQLRKLVRDQVMRDHAERGLIPMSDAPLIQPDSSLPKELVTALGGADAVKKEVMREAQNVRSIELKNMDGRSFLNEGSQEYVDQKVEAFKRWQAENAGTANGGALKNNPEVKQMLESVAIDTLGTHQRLDPSLRPYYKFSPQEIDARQNQVDAAKQRLTEQLKAEGDTTKLVDHPEGKKLTERGQVIDLQKQLLTDFQSGNVQQARARATELLQKMQAEPHLYAEDVRFMEERGLLTHDQVKGTKFEPLLREALPVRDGITHGDARIAALETPGFTSERSGGWGIGRHPELEANSHLPKDSTYRTWLENSIQRLGREGSRIEQLEEGIKTGRVKFSVLDRNALDSLSDRNQIWSREGGRERNSLPYKTNGSTELRQPLRHADLYDPAKHDQAVLVIRSEVNGRERYEVVNGNRRIHVFGSETLNPQNLEIPVLVFDSAESLKQITGIEVSTAEPTPFKFEPEMDPAKRAKMKDLPENIARQSGYTRAVDLADPGLPELVRQTLNHSAAEAGVAEKIVAQAQKYSAESKSFRDGTVLTPAQCLDLAMLETMKDTKTGDKMRAPSALKRLRELTELRENLNRDLTVNQGMEVLRLQETYPELSKNPGQAFRLSTSDSLAAAESVHAKLGGSATLSESRAIAEYPQHLADPKFALEILRTANTMKGAASVKGSGYVNSTPLGKWLGMALIAHDQGLSPYELKTVEKTDALFDKNRETFAEFVKPAAPTPTLEPGELFAKEVPKAAKDLRTSIEGLIEGKLGTTADKSVSDWMQAMVEDATNKKTEWSAEELAKFKDIADRYKRGEPEAVRQVNDWLDKAATDMARPAELAGPRSTIEVPSPVGAEQLGNYRDLFKVIKNLEGTEFLGEVARTAKGAVSHQITNRLNKLAFSNTQMNFTESSSLRPGESELIIRHGDKVIKPTSFEGGNGVQPAYITADGTKIPARDVKVEIKVGAGSSKDQIAREGLVRSQQLAEIVQGKSQSGVSALAEAKAIRNAFEQVAPTGDSKAGKAVADRVATLGEFEFQSKRQPVELTKTGVKIGNQKEITFEQLVKDTTVEKQKELDRLQKEKQTSSEVELSERIEAVKRQIAELKSLGSDIQSAESVGRLIEAIKKHATPEEVAKIKAEGGRRGEGVKGGVNRLGAYALVGVFVATTLAGSSYQGDTSSPTYAPTSSK